MPEDSSPDVAQLLGHLGVYFKPGPVVPELDTGVLLDVAERCGIDRNELSVYLDPGAWVLAQLNEDGLSPDGRDRAVETFASAWEAVQICVLRWIAEGEQEWARSELAGTDAGQLRLLVEARRGLLELIDWLGSQIRDAVSSAPE